MEKLPRLTLPDKKHYLAQHLVHKTEKTTQNEQQTTFETTSKQHSANSQQAFLSISSIIISRVSAIIISSNFQSRSPLEI
jgi:hypothetical protein